MCWYCFSMRPIHDYLDSRHSTAVRLRNAVVLLVLVMLINGLLFLLGVEACSALVRADIVDVPTAINIGLFVGVAWVWLSVAKIPHVPVPALHKKSIVPSLLLCVLSAASTSFISFTPTVPTSPPRSVSFAI